MAVRRAQPRPGQLWQVPALAISLGLFGYAAYLFIGPRLHLSISQRIDVAEAYLKHDRPEPAIDLLNKVLETSKLPPRDEGRARLLLAASLERGQKLHHLRIESNYQSVIDQTLSAIKLGIAPAADDYRRLGQSYDALSKPTEALAGYRRAIELDPQHSTPLVRRVIDLQLNDPDTAAAEESLERYLKDGSLSKADRAWGLDRKAELLTKKGAVSEARPLLDEALSLDPNPIAQGVARYYQGYCAWKLHEPAEAERLLRVARDLLKTSHPQDAEAAYLLGHICQERNSPAEAISFYNEVLIGHPESRPAPLALLGRGQCRIMAGGHESGLSDLHELVKFLTAKPSRASYNAEAIAGLKQASANLVTAQNLQGAMEAMAYEQMLAPEPPAEFFGRLASVYERRAEQLEKSSSESPPSPEKQKIDQQVRDLRTRAGDAFVALSRKLTLTDDRGSGEALWRGVELYDRAGATSQAIAALGRFASERPDDGQAPDALLRLGRAYQANGEYDKAITAFLRNQFRYPQSLAASKSGVPLAQCYIAQGPKTYAKAEKVLLAVVENNPVLTPEAEEFRQALFELAQLCYRTGRFEEAVSRLEEMTQRYPNDIQSAQLVYLMADSYRKSAALLAAASASTPQPSPAGPTTAPTAAELLAAREEAAAARAERLQKAQDLFDRTIVLYQQSPPRSETDSLYFKLAHFFRADCAYDLGHYEQAIKLYNTATLRYQDDPASLAGYVQIVNAYLAMGKPDEARAANERARWLLRKMPPEAFDKAKSSLPKQYWDDWLTRTAESGMWAKK